MLAPALSSIFTTSKNPPCAALNKAVIPVDRFTLGSAPCSSNSATHDRCPLAEAKIRGVAPF